MTHRTASCSCGQLTAVVTEEPQRVSICHCLACQRRSGSVFAAQARFRRAAVQVHGESTQYLRAGDEGPGATFSFCPRCGATVWYEPVGGDSLVIPVGAFADPGFPPPTLSVYEERKHAWVVVPQGVEHVW